MAKLDFELTLRWSVTQLLCNGIKTPPYSGEVEFDRRNQTREV